jgi:threonine dehydrogenase-like Zn-dependent dehydrogenase
VVTSPSGDQGIGGTFYVNINSPVSFTTVVASSTQYAFEFDNVAFGGPQIAAVPEPSTILVFGAGLLGLRFIGLRRSRLNGAESDDR